MNLWLIILPGLVLAGSVAGFFSSRLPMSGKLALGFSLLPGIGFGLTPLFCWGHPLQMLGPSIIFGSAPFALGYSLYARARATTNRPLTYIAIGLAALAALFVAWGIVAVGLDFITS